MKVFAYMIVVKGAKQIGGTMHADSMEDAVNRIARRNELRITTQEYPAHRVTEWIFRGKKASVAVWAPPEYFYNPEDNASGNH